MTPTMQENLMAEHLGHGYCKREQLGSENETDRNRSSLYDSIFALVDSSDNSYPDTNMAAWDSESLPDMNHSPKCDVLNHSLYCL